MPVIPMTFQDTGRFVVNPNDLFITPEAVALYSCQALKKLTGVDGEDDKDFRVLDPGCGSGRWGAAVNRTWNRLFTQVYGVDLAPTATITEYEEIVTKDFLVYEEDFAFDLIIGNPPYSSATDRNLAEKFIRKSMELLKPKGYLAFLLKTEYVASLQRADLWKTKQLKYMVQYVPRIKFDGYQFSNTIEYSFYIFQKDSNQRPEVWWLNWHTGELY